MANAAGYLLFMPKYYFLKLLDLPRPPPNPRPYYTLLGPCSPAPSPNILIMFITFLQIKSGYLQCTKNEVFH